MLKPYQYVKFVRAGSSVKEKGIFLPACTPESGNYQARSVATIDHVGDVAEVLELSTVAIVKE